MSCVQAVQASIKHSMAFVSVDTIISVSRPSIRTVPHHYGNDVISPPLVIYKSLYLSTAVRLLQSNAERSVICAWCSLSPDAVNDRFSDVALFWRRRFHGYDKPPSAASCFDDWTSMVDRAGSISGYRIWLEYVLGTCYRNEAQWLHHVARTDDCVPRDAAICRSSRLIKFVSAAAVVSSFCWMEYKHHRLYIAYIYICLRPRSKAQESAASLGFNADFCRTLLVLAMTIHKWIWCWVIKPTLVLCR